MKKLLTGLICIAAIVFTAGWEWNYQLVKKQPKEAASTADAEMEKEYKSLLKERDSLQKWKDEIAFKRVSMTQEEWDNLESKKMLNNHIDAWNSQVNMYYTKYGRSAKRIFILSKL